MLKPLQSRISVLKYDFFYDFLTQRRSLSIANSPKLCLNKCTFLAWFVDFHASFQCSESQVLISWSTQ